eukprot:356630-Chlamydomonas_euryale.AAC.5
MPLPVEAHSARLAMTTQHAPPCWLPSRPHTLSTMPQLSWDRVVTGNKAEACAGRSCARLTGMLLLAP